MANEKRLIDANALLDKLIKTSRYFDVKFDIEEAPTVDAVEVVRCKDCRWRNTKGCPYMNFNATARDDEDYCSDGERREGE